VTATDLVTGPALEAWQRLLRVACSVHARLDADLREMHNLTLSDYDVLVQLRDSDDGALRMSDLSRLTLLTRSGMTRLIDGLVRDGYVVRRPCPKDARVAWAVITDAGRERLAVARIDHHAGIRRVFADHFNEHEADQLADLLAKIPHVSALDR
jgi:DNA-binding MarR family transcriptional regulator